MNTNHEDTGVTVALRKTGNIVHLDVSTVAGTVGIQLDDTKSVYTAMHEAKNDIARLVSQSIDKAVVWMSDANDEAQLFTPTDAASVLDGKQVATPVNVDDSYAGRITHGGFFAQPVLEMPDFGDIDALHAEALAEDTLRTADDEPTTKVEGAAKRGG